MSRFRRQYKEDAPKISTSSLPDIIFMLLFFFMVTTTLRSMDSKLKITLPNANQAKKIEKRSLVTHVYIGTPLPELQTKYGTEPRIQVEDKYISINDLKSYILGKKQSLNENDRNEMIVALHIDENTPMGIVTDVKQELRKCEVLNINYSTIKSKNNLNN